MATLANDPIMYGRLIWPLRYLKHQNLSTGDDFSTVVEKNLVPFLVTKEALAPLANDPIMLGRSEQSFRHLECQNLAISLDFIDINT